MTARVQSLEKAWAQLAKRAIVGIGRIPRSEEGNAATGLPVDGLMLAIEQNSGSDPAKALLLSAGALGVYRRAGRLPATLGSPLPKPCRMDRLAEAPPAAGRRLAGLLRENHPTEAGLQRAELLLEWLALAAGAGVRIPLALLPETLELAACRPKLESMLSGPARSTLGERGAWLAAQNPDWAFAAALENPGENWQTGTTLRRKQLLQRLRFEWPEEGLRLLSATWDQEHADQRSEFLACLETNLSMADEPFLEAALDDRAQSVRQAAAELLKKLPASRLAGRMRERADGLLVYETGRWPLQTARLAIHPPDEYDPTWERDGILKKPRAGAGERGWWLQQIIAAAPPAYWTSRWRITPEELLLRLAESEWEALLLEAFSKAARRCPNSAWIKALLDIDSERPELLEALPAGDAQAYIIAVICRRKDGRGLWIAARYRAPWSRELTGEAIEALHRHAPALNTNPADWSALRLVTQMAYFMDPDMQEYAEHWLRREAPSGSALEKTFSTLLEILDYRRKMKAEFTKAGRV